MKSLTLRNNLQLREAELELRRLEQAIGKLRVEHLEEKTQRLLGSTRFAEQDLAAKLALLDSLEAELRDELQATQTRLRETSQQWLHAQQALERGAGDPPAEDAAEPWNLLRQSQEEQASLLNQTLRDLAVCRLCWRRRYELANGTVKPETVRAWSKEAQTFRERMQRSRQLLELRSQDRRGELVALRRTSLQQGQRPADPGQPEMAAQIAEVDRIVRAYESRLVAVAASERLLDRFAAELGGRAESLSTLQRLMQCVHALRNVWYYEITSVDDRPVTVAKACSGLTLIVLGMLFARMASRQVRRRVVPRLGLDQGAAAALQTIIFYALLACSVFFSFELVHLPLTVFTFLGGAVAIGVGFGSQNVLSNFISGLILLAERPIRVGDLVDIEGLYGTVEDIGAHSTRLRTGSNLEIIVPNSKFLESNVTNWTLSDTRIRLQVSVGVGYGSPTRSVEQLLKDSVHDHPQILPEPAPIVIFTDFGDNALQFQVHFWMQMRSLMEGEKVKSEIRHTIDDLFRAHHITIAYPQRDIHLDMQSPIQVQVRRFPEADADPQRGLRAA